MTCHRFFRAGIVAVALNGCATLAGPSSDLDAERPNAGAGPFRPLAQQEIRSGTGVAPYVLPLDSARRYRDAAALRPAGIGADADRIALFAVAETTDGARIFRFTSSDGRTFDRLPTPRAPMLDATETWQGGAMTAPSAIWVGSEIWLAFAAAGGIGLARSSDGVRFTPDPEPILAADSTSAWEGGAAPGGPSLHVAPDGSVRLLYAAGGRIGEARSSDGGATWVRTGVPLLDPVDVPRAAGSAVARLGDPDIVIEQAPGTRMIARVFLSLELEDGTRSVGLAARFDDDGPLSPADAPVLASNLEPHAPAVLRFEAGYSLLYATARAGLGRTEDYDAELAAVAPATWHF